MSTNKQSEHPGTMTIVDGDTGKVIEECDISTVPPAMRFLETPEGRIPIVRVVATTSGGQRFIREYGPDGTLLRSTVALINSQT